MLEFYYKLLPNYCIRSIVLPGYRIHTHIALYLFKVRLPFAVPLCFTIRTGAVAFTLMPKMRNAQPAPDNQFHLWALAKQIAASIDKIFPFKVHTRSYYLTT